jgi:cytochrome c553
MRISLFFSMLLVCGTLGISRSQADTPAPRGQTLFIANNCYQCHDRMGQGGVGPTITPPHLPQLARFMAFVRAPSNPAMPPYTKAVLSDQDLAAIWGYLDSVPPPGPVLPEALARLRPASSEAHPRQQASK